MRVLALTLMMFYLGLPIPLFASQPPGEEQLTAWLDDQLQDDGVDDLAYTRQTVKGEDSRVEHFDPRRDAGEQWELVQEDGETPDAERLTEYREEKREATAEDEAGEDEEDNDNRLVDPATLMLSDETETHWVYSFRPRIEEFEDQLDRVEGHLYVPRDASFVERIEIENTEDIEPAFMVDIHHFTLSIEFDQLADGRAVIRRTESDVRGRAFGLKQVDENYRQEWSEYEVVAEDDEAPEAGTASGD